MPLPLEDLPREVRLAILSRLPYESLISLSQVSRSIWRAVGNPAGVAAYPDKLAFVMRAEKDFGQHFPRTANASGASGDHPGNFACYFCFRVRGPEHFDECQGDVAYDSVEGRVVRLGQERQPQQQQQEQRQQQQHNHHHHHSLHQQTPQRIQSLRRFCIDCGLKYGMHEPGDLIGTRTKLEMWVCNCRRLCRKPDVLRCGACGADCPLRPRRKQALGG